MNGIAFQSVGLVQYVVWTKLRIYWNPMHFKVSKRICLRVLPGVCVSAGMSTMPPTVTWTQNCQVVNLLCPTACGNY